MFDFNDFTPYEIEKGEAYMSPGQKAHFKSILEDWRDSLIQECDRTVEHLKTEAVNCPDPNDRASQESDFALELRTRDREGRLIQKINSALVMLERGEYGLCKECGVEISLRRLEARPTADLCIECKSMQEMKERR